MERRKWNRVYLFIIIIIMIIKMIREKKVFIFK